MLPRGVKFPSSTLDHHTTSLVNFIPDKFNLKQEIEPFKQKQKASESQSQNNTPARIMYVQNSYLQVPTYWEKYTKGDLNLKWPKWGSSDIPKLIFLHVQKKPAIRSNILKGIFTLVSRRF